ncbi:GNAT family N-acetyltransferase [Lentimicrobium sp. S6]|uniref:GNAT family N-acetyltransferase n=1 Tax=Lentimicrobium sp. S6 TaxID=2735872 RepID=UPI0015570152|nr:GNAT family N-acetyltransferase [Lentimicrobium sp. S6]NPD46744.1 peptidoglycan bridge formation glycyltransferase FemA/FemB family protein [Lentimicrobium sp. S6]
MNLPDIYFEPEWGQLYAEKDKGEYSNFVFEDENGLIYYSFVKRKIDIEVDGESYFDIVSPYGFGGPVVLHYAEGCKHQLLATFKIAFDAFCKRENIVTDSCRFSPWLMNHLDFEHMYEVVPNFSTVGIDLSVEDVFMDEIKSKKRNMIRKAQKLGVEIHFDFEGKEIDSFIRVYEKTIEKNSISDYYRFSASFFKKNFEELKDKICIAYATYEKKIISIAFFLLGSEYVHYHLAANDTDYFGIPANDLMLYKVALYGKEIGKKYFMLGGAGSNKALHSHKMGFTREGEYPFFKGRRVCDKEIYDKLLQNCTKVDMNFFPSYR